MTDPTPARPGTADELREEFARAMYASDYPSDAWDSDATLVREEYRALADAVVATDGVQRLLAVEQQRAALEQRVRELAEELKRDSARYLGRLTRGSYDDGVVRAYDHVAARIDRALGGGDDA